MAGASGVEPVDAGIQAHCNPIVIGFVNNMADAALRTAERQFRDLLLAGPFGHRVHLRWFFLPDIPRSDIIQPYLRQHYENIADLWTSEVDALIVTGAEPRAATLRQEPYWNSLAKLVDWAENHTLSTVWSCLAAHAAVLHTDGIDRAPLNEKLSGVFGCQKVADHPLLSGMPSTWHVPHSRYNGLPATALEAMGYKVLTTSSDAGVDLFIKQRRSLFVFTQGHPEYNSDALFREYRRDVTRFLSGERNDFPEVPKFYFDHKTATALSAFRLLALQQRSVGLLANFPTGVAEATLKHSWRDTARCLFANWIAYLVTKKPRQAGVRDITSRHLVGIELGELAGANVPHHGQQRTDLGRQL